MIYFSKPNRNAGLWWTAIVSIVLGGAVLLFLHPAEHDAAIQRIRAAALVIIIFVPGICLIVGTSRRWFGKGL